MRRLSVLLFLLFAYASGMLSAQTAAPADDTPDVPLIDRAHAQDWSRDIDSGWRMHEGDDPSWANPTFDDGAWEKVELDDLGPSRPGWRWFRLHLKLHENHPDLSLLIDGGVGTYSLYVNGVAVEGPELRSSLRVNRPNERAIALDVPDTDLVLALRTHTTPAYANWHLPLFLGVSIGTPDAMDAQRQALESVRFYPLIPAVAINLLLILAGIGAFSLHVSQPGHPEYRWLSLYLFLVGTADLFWYCQHSGVLPLSANFLIADPLLYAVAIAQIEFTFSFGGVRVGRVFRIYEILLLLPLPLVWLTWQGQFPSDSFIVVESLILVPVAVLLPIMLLLWYRRGNREAGWLILPSLLPAASISLYDFGTLAIFVGWKRFEFLDNSISIGPFAIQVNDLCNLLFLLAIVVVMFFRFTRVSREQARTAAELSAAREIQQRLVPASLPELTGFHIETAYLPAQEVGGDFYQVLEQTDGYALIVVGDVSGKGLKAAMTGALAIGALRTLAAENYSPGTLLARLNSQMLSTQESGFITCLCLRISSEGAVTFANAGHLSPYLHSEEVPVDSGLPLGLSAAAEYSETAFQLAPGDTLTLLSDGVVEAMNADHQLFGFERTAAISGQPADQIAKAAELFGQEDDITVLTLTRTS
jgi:serine phosphatase RsbU (regulator of sigma subunit)